MVKTRWILGGKVLLRHGPNTLASGHGGFSFRLRSGSHIAPWLRTPFLTLSYHPQARNLFVRVGRRWASVQPTQDWHPKAYGREAGYERTRG